MPPGYLFLTLEKNNINYSNYFDTILGLIRLDRLKNLQPKFVSSYLINSTRSLYACAFRHRNNWEILSTFCDLRRKPDIYKLTCPGGGMWSREPSPPRLAAVVVKRLMAPKDLPTRVIFERFLFNFLELLSSSTFKWAMQWRLSFQQYNVNNKGSKKCLQSLHHRY